MIAFLLILSSLVSAQTPRTAAPKGAEVYFISPKDGESIKGPVTVRFGLKGMGIAPAGVVKENTGHHHLLIDVESIDLSLPIASDDTHKHYGGGQTETLLELPPGKHTLQMVLGDLNHFAHDPPILSKKITITVKK